MRLRGKTAIVTGAGSGIGRAIAGRFAREGAAVLLTDVNSGAGESAAEEIRKEGRDAAFLAADVTDAEHGRRMVQAARDRWGGLDILVNNAGIGEGGAVAQMEESLWDRVLSVNLKGVYLCAQAAFPLLAQRGGAAIVNVASLAGLMAHEGMGAYAASKAGVIQLTKVLALEGAPYRIRANAVCPVWIDTPMVWRYLEGSGRPEEMRRALEARVPLGRFGTTEDVAAAALFLASDEAAFITGVALPIDGGTLCR